MLGSFLCIAEGLPPLFSGTSSKDLLPLPTALLHPLPYPFLANLVPLLTSGAGFLNVGTNDTLE